MVSRILVFCNSSEPLLREELSRLVKSMVVQLPWQEGSTSFDYDVASIEPFPGTQTSFEEDWEFYEIAYEEIQNFVTVIRETAKNEHFQDTIQSFLFNTTLLEDKLLGAELANHINNSTQLFTVEVTEGAVSDVWEMVDCLLALIARNLKGVIADNHAFYNAEQDLIAQLESAQILNR